MPRYLNTRGKSSLAIALCDRCHFKAAWSDLIPDPNTPGLMVHPHCADEVDPWRLPFNAPDQISMPWARPDSSLATDPAGLITEDSTSFMITEDGGSYLVI